MIISAPTDFYQPNSIINIRLQTAIADLAGNKLDSPYLFSFETGPSPDFGPPEITDINIIHEITSAQISWKTDEKATTNIYYGLKKEYDLQSPVVKDESADNTEHFITLNNLKEGETYNLQIVSSDRYSNESKSENLSFTLGDIPCDDFSGAITPSIETNISSADINWNTIEYTDTYTINITGPNSYSKIQSGKDLTNITLSNLVNGTYNINLKAIHSGCESIQTTTTFVINKPLDASITINNNAAYANNINVNLNIYADDATEMYVSNSPSLDEGVWEAYATTRNWDLLSGDGEKVVYIKFKDSIGNVFGASSEYSDNIILQTVGPSGGTIVINNDDEYTNNTAVTLEISAINATDMRISTNSSFSTGTWETYSTSKSWTLNSGDGDKNLYIKFKDVANNQIGESGEIKDIIKLDTFAPSQVENITADEDDYKITLSWTEPSDADFEKIEITYSPGGVTIYVDKGTTTKEITGLTNHTEYTFTIKAIDHAGNKSASTQKQETPRVIGKYWTNANATGHWVERFRHTSVVYDNKMWILGGSNRNDIWWSTDGTNWTNVRDNLNVSNCWSKREGHASVVYDNKMWVFGGYYDDVWWSTDGLDWTNANASGHWGDRSYHTSVVYDNKMWVMGGYSSGKKNDVWWSTDGTNWTNANATGHWSPRVGHKSVVYDNKMWIFGGDDGNEKNDVWWSTDGTNWTNANATGHWNGRREHTSVVYDNKMWVMGGFSNTYESNVWWSTDGTNWTNSDAFDHWTDGRKDHTSIVYDNKIWIMGGKDWGGYRNDVWWTY